MKILQLLLCWSTLLIHVYRVGEPVETATTTRFEEGNNNIRWRNSDRAAIRNAVSRFNRLITNELKRGGDIHYLPEKVNTKDIIAQIGPIRCE